MISIYKIKPKFQQLLKPILAWLHKRKVTANQLTVAAIVFSAGLGACLWFSSIWDFSFLIVPIGLLLRMALNALDGMMARTYNMQSKLGEVLNELGDVISDMFIYIPLIKLNGSIPEVVIIFVSLSIVNEFAGFMGKVISEERRYDGPMGKSDRALVVGVLCLTLFFTPLNAWVVNGILIGSSILMIISTVVRLNKALKNG
tara:strand:+ start:1017 stop:1619 length:603 start_codon:yes stop_codon:yes gene_type:complete